MEQILEKIKELKVLVIGDIILDKYYDTEVSRISPEAPVPVARYLKEDYKLGGAGNVALNLSKLGAKTTIIGKIGWDKDGRKIKTLFNKNKIKFIPIFIETDTISKIRVVSKSNQILRLDFEDKKTYFENSFKRIKTEIESIIKDIDFIVISDYQKGVLNNDLINYLKKLKKYISIDAKPGIFSDFSGFSLVKPNFSEAVNFAKFLGNTKKFNNTDEDVEELISFLKKRLNSNILITRSEKGASFIENDNKILHSKTKVNEVNDVTGAGDTCISIFSCLNYLKYDSKKSLELMNIASKIVVSKFGTYAPNIEEIKNEFTKKEDWNIITSEKRLKEIVEEIKKEKKKIVFTNGCFDLLHKGHVSFLKKAKQLGDILIVGINSDESVKKLKGKDRPIIDEESRAFVLSNLKSVDYVVIFDELNPIKLIEKIKPKIHTKGSDYKSKENLIETKTVEKNGGKVVLLELEKDISTSNIIGKIRKK